MEAIEQVMTEKTEELPAEMPRERYNFGTAQAKLAVHNTDPNYHYHWANDTPGRVELFLAAAYAFVKKGEVSLLPGAVPRDSDLGDRVSAVVGRNEDGTPLRAYLMKKLLSLYNEDQRRGQERPDAIDKAIREGRTTQDTVGRDFYVPKSTPIKMTSEVGRRKPPSNDNDD